MIFQLYARLIYIKSSRRNETTYPDLTKGIIAAKQMNATIKNSFAFKTSAFLVTPEVSRGGSILIKHIIRSQHIEW